MLLRKKLLRIFIEANKRERTNHFCLDCLFIGHAVHRFSFQLPNVGQHQEQLAWKIRASRKNDWSYSDDANRHHHETLQKNHGMHRESWKQAEAIDTLIKSVYTKHRDR